MKKSKIIESMSKTSANLDEIVNNVDEMEAILNSREFITTLVNDIINNKRNVKQWKLIDGVGSLEDIDPDSMRETFGVDYNFDFIYDYNGQIIPLTLFITGQVPYNVTSQRSGNWLTPPEGGDASVDYKNLGAQIDLGLFDREGNEIDISWLTPQLQSKVAAQVLQDYV